MKVQPQVLKLKVQRTQQQTLKLLAQQASAPLRWQHLTCRTISEYASQQRLKLKVQQHPQQHDPMSEAILQQRSAPLCWR